MPTMGDVVELAVRRGLVVDELHAPGPTRPGHDLSWVGIECLFFDPSPKVGSKIADRDRRVVVERVGLFERCQRLADRSVGSAST